MQIDTQALSQWLHSHKGKDINQLLTKAVTQSYAEAFPEQTLSKHIIKRGQYFLAIIIASILTTAATSILVGYHFQDIALYSIFSNLIAIPLTEFIIMPFGLNVNPTKANLTLSHSDD